MASKLHPCEAALASLPERLLVAVSGGVDSIALLHALVAIGRKPIVLHFDHGWREDSAKDAKWVRNQARRLRLKFVTARIRPPEDERCETDARVERYAFFEKMAKKLKIPHLVLAHHADDQVETFLMQLLRGTGAGGRGMEAVTERDGLVLHRPWLGIWKRQIVAYARQHKLTWKEDETNNYSRHRRNRVRKQILPYLRKHWSADVAKNLLRAAEIARAESECLDALCADLARGAELPVKALRAANLALQRRTILRWLQARAVRDISFADVEAVRGLLTHRDPAKINLSAGKFARRRSGKIFVDGPAPA
jgi:tRNA(Ile)-lysidine synthetase-like protein